MRLDRAVQKETVFVLCVTLVGSALVQAVFLVIGHWNYTVLLGNVLGIVAAVGNFLLMGITVQKALEKEAKEAALLMRVSQMLRMLLLFVVALIGHLLPIFHLVAVVIPYLFPWAGMMVRQLLSARK
jgi:hypothetical protein